jgi:ankyrin repeat protein
LLAEGADVNERSMSSIARYGWTALHYAAVMNDPNMIRMLIGQGADPYLVGKGGNCIRVALAKDKYMAVATLVSLGVRTFC